jgi:hypothetical protein
VGRKILKREIKRILNRARGIVTYSQWNIILFGFKKYANEVKISYII